SFFLSNKTAAPLSLFSSLRLDDAAATGSLARRAAGATSKNSKDTGLPFPLSFSATAARSERCHQQRMARTTASPTRRAKRRRRLLSPLSLLSSFLFSPLFAGQSAAAAQREKNSNNCSVQQRRMTSPATGESSTAMLGHRRRRTITTVTQSPPFPESRAPASNYNNKV
ncbi:hypothetical protein AABB24_025930, partial [Solanum stoloniferum]